MTAGALPPPERTSVLGRAALVLGGAALGAAVLLGLTGLVRSAFYDRSAEGPLGAVSAKARLDVLGNARAIDRNVKHLRDATGRTEGAYEGNLAEIARAEAGIPSISASTERVYRNVRGLRRALGDVDAANERIGGRIARLVELQRQANALLGGLSGRTVGLVGTMSTLLAATRSVEGRVARIDVAARRIARAKLPAAVARTAELNRLLPPRVPPKRYEPIR